MIIFIDNFYEIINNIYNRGRFPAFRQTSGVSFA